MLLMLLLLLLLLLVMMLVQMLTGRFCEAWTARRACLLFISAVNVPSLPSVFVFSLIAERARTAAAPAKL